MVQYKRAVAEIKVCLIDNFGSVGWLMVHALLLCVGKYRLYREGEAPADPEPSLATISWVTLLVYVARG